MTDGPRVGHQGAGEEVLETRVLRTILAHRFGEIDPRVQPVEQGDRKPGEPSGVAAAGEMAEQA